MGAYACESLSRFPFFSPASLPASTTRFRLIWSFPIPICPLPLTHYFSVFSLFLSLFLFILFLPVHNLPFFVQSKVHAGYSNSHISPRFYSTDIGSNLGITMKISIPGRTSPEPKPSLYTELGFFHVISAFCATGVWQNAEITRKNPSSLASPTLHHQK